MSDVTRLLNAAQSGDRQADADLLPLVYDELRQLAAARMVGEAPGHTLDSTALVHEAYIRLVGDQHFDGRGHFFNAVSGEEVIFAESFAIKVSLQDYLARRSPTCAQNLRRLGRYADGSQPHWFHSVSIWPRPFASTGQS